jgi:hypothetical protein
LKKQAIGLIAALVIGLAVGSAGMYLLAASQLESLLAMSYLRSASEVRGYALALGELRSKQEARAISRIEGYLSGALISLDSYEDVVPAGKREPRLYESLADVRRYVEAYPEVKLSAAAAATLSLSDETGAP